MISEDINTLWYITHLRKRAISRDSVQSSQRLPTSDFSHRKVWNASDRIFRWKQIGRRPTQSTRKAWRQPGRKLGLTPVSILPWRTCWTSDWVLKCDAGKMRWPRPNAVECGLGYPIGCDVTFISRNFLNIGNIINHAISSAANTNSPVVEVSVHVDERCGSGKSIIGRAGFIQPFIMSEQSGRAPF
jgi:hypothetical protein